MTAKFRELANALKDESPRFDRSSMASMAPLAFLLGSARANIQPRSPDNVSRSVLNNQINDVIFADKTAVIDFRRELRNCVINIYNPKKVIFGKDVSSTTKSEKREAELEEKRQGGGLLGFLKKKRNLPGMAGTGKTFKDSDADAMVDSGGLFGKVFDFFRGISTTEIGLGLLGLGTASRFNILGRGIGFVKNLVSSAVDNLVPKVVQDSLASQKGSFKPQKPKPTKLGIVEATDDFVKKKVGKEVGEGVISRFAGRIGGGVMRFLLHPAFLPATLGIEALNLLYVQPLLDEVQRLSDEYYQGQIEYSNIIRAGQFRALFNGQHPAAYHETTAKILEELQREIAVRIDEIETEIKGHFSGKPELRLSKETIESLRIEKRQLGKIEPPLSYLLEFPETSSTMKLNVPVRMNEGKAPDYSDIIFLHRKLAEMKSEQKTLMVGGTELFAPAEGMPRIVGYEMHRKIVPDDGRLFKGEQQVEKRPIFDFAKGRRSMGPQAEEYTPPFDGFGVRDETRDLAGFTRLIGDLGIGMLGGIGPSPMPIFFPGTLKGNADDNIIMTHEVIERERLTPDQQKTNKPDPNFLNFLDGYDSLNINYTDGFDHPPTN